MAQYIDIIQTPTITASSAYVSGNALGGLLTFADILRYGSANLRAIILTDKANQKAAIDLLLFNQSFTATANKSAIAISTSDALNLIGRISIGTSAYTTIGTGAEATVSGLIHPVIGSSGANTLYGQLVVRGTPTYASTSDIQVRLVLERYLSAV